MPTLPDHRGHPLFRRIEYFILRPAHLRPLKRTGNLEAQFPAERVRDEPAGGLELLTAAVLVEAERVAEMLGSLFATHVAPRRLIPLPTGLWRSRRTR